LEDGGVGRDYLGIIIVDVRAAYRKEGREGRGRSGGTHAPRPMCVYVCEPVSRA